MSRNGQSRRNALEFPEALATNQPLAPVKYQGAFVYKYRSVKNLERLKEILEGKLYFPTARDLNDPEEARPKEDGDAIMSSTPRFSQLSPARQALVRLCQRVNFGTIENLRVGNSQPVFDPAPMILKDVKLDADDEPRPETLLLDFVVSAEVLRLMRRLDEMKSGIIRRTEVRAGVPRRIVLEAPEWSPPDMRQH